MAPAKVRSRNKSVLARARLDYAIPPVINPDLIARRMNASDPDTAALAAGREAVRPRDAAIAKRESFAIETTLSGHSELETIRKAKAAGDPVTMTYIGVESAEMSALRVFTRARDETRTVPRAVILRRYPRSLANLTATLSVFDRVDLYDNSAPELRSLARFDRGRVVAAANDMPALAAQALRERLPLRAIVRSDQP